MGCGRVGSTLARNLAKSGHSVAIIDRDEASFQRLPPSFEGRRVVGVGFDRATLVEAGIEQAYAFAAVSSGDNSNILAARVARENYQVEHVVARIYDPGRAQVYERLGIPTVATVRWTADQVMQRILPGGCMTVHQDAAGTIRIEEVTVNPAWIGTPYRELEQLTGARIAYVSRFGAGVMMRDDLVHQQGDRPYVVMPTTDVTRVEQLVAAPPRPDGDANLRPTSHSPVMNSVRPTSGKES